MGMKPKKKEKSIEAILSELKPKIGFEEAKSHLQQESKLASLLPNLTSTDWKVRFDCLTSLTQNLGSLVDSQKSAECLLVFLKESSKNFKESNLNIVRSLLDLSQKIVETMNSGPVFHTVANLLVEMLSGGKFDDKIEEVISSVGETMDRNQILVCLLDSFRVKF